MKKIYIAVAGMTCNHCEQKITEALQKVKGIDKVKASVKTGLVEIFYHGDKFKEASVKDNINKLGYLYKGIVEEHSKNRQTTFKEVLPIFITIMIIYLIIGSFAGFNFFNFLPTINQTTPLILLFLIGLLTSIHCVGMCGAINLAASVGNENKPSLSRPLFYNLGRIISYTITGGIVGGLGSVISFSTSMQGLLLLITTIFMLMMGLSMLGWLPHSLYKFMPKMPSKLRHKYTNNNAPFMIGLLNGIMPCGPLQAMQLYALSTGSIWLGALSMFIFALGTTPLMFGVGVLFSTLKNKYNVIIHRISSVLILFLAFGMLLRAFTYWGIDLTQIIHNKLEQGQYNDYVIAEIKDGYQYVEIELNPRGYTPILVQKDIPVKFNIKVQNVEYYGCTSSIRISDLGITKDLSNGDNIIDFTPNKKGDISYSCWMGMVTSNIKVVDDLNKIKETINKVEE